MTWKHSGKVEAFDEIGLDQQTAQQYGLAYNPADLMSARIFVSRQALVMLASLNHFDQQKVIKEIAFVCNNPNSCSSTKHSLMPFKRFYRTKDQFRSYHYLIDFKITKNDQVVIHDIYLDQTVVGPKSRHRLERNVLYNVDRLGSRFDGVFDSEDLKKAQSAWVLDELGTSHVSNQHAAVNGMQNELDKATWLMGAHLDAAYPKDDFVTYTLFHNPTDRMFYDVVECVFDKRQGTKSQNAQHLAAILYQNQQQGKKVKWVVHQCH